MEKSTQTASPILPTTSEAQSEPLEPLRGSAVNESCGETGACSGETSAVESTADAYFVRIVGRNGDFVRTVPKPFTKEDAQKYAAGFNEHGGHVRAAVCNAPEAFTEYQPERFKRLDIEIVRDGVVQHVLQLEDPRGKFIGKLNQVLRVSDVAMFARMPVTKVESCQCDS